jgi:hypothetical protein
MRSGPPTRTLLCLQRRTHPPVPAAFVSTRTTVIPLANLKTSATHAPLRPPRRLPHTLTPPPDVASPPPLPRFRLGLLRPRPRTRRRRMQKGVRPSASSYTCWCPERSWHFRVAAMCICSGFRRRWKGARTRWHWGDAGTMWSASRAAFTYPFPCMRLHTHNQ